MLVDPHFRTLDGTKFSYHGECDLVLTRGLYNTNVPIDVHIRTTIVDDWSLISNVAIRIGNTGTSTGRQNYDIFEVVNDGTVYWNGQINPTLPISIANGRFTIIKNEERIQIDNDAEQIKVNNSTTVSTTSSQEILHTSYQIQLDGTDNIMIGDWLQMLSVNVSAYLTNAEGVIGVRNVPGMIGRDHTTTYTNPNDMGTEWQVRSNDDGILFLSNTQRQPQYPTQCTLPSTISRRRRLGETSHLRDHAYSACTGIVDPTLIEYCIEDVLLTGNINVAKAYHR
jgi:von Willebrand factor type D domain